MSSVQRSASMDATVRQVAALTVASNALVQAVDQHTREFVAVTRRLNAHADALKRDEAVAVVVAVTFWQRVRWILVGR